MGQSLCVIFLLPGNKVSMYICDLCDLLPQSVKLPVCIQRYSLVNVPQNEIWKMGQRLSFFSFKAKKLACIHM